MTRRLPVTAALIIAFGAFFLSDPPPSAYHAPTLGLSEHRGIGLIQHRGQFYRFEDLMDPQYRAQSNDSFVKSFAGERHLAIPWAGKGDAKETLGDLQTRQREIWQSEQDSLMIKFGPALKDRIPDRLPWAGIGPEKW